MVGYIISISITESIFMNKAKKPIQPDLPTIDLENILNQPTWHNAPLQKGLPEKIERRILV